MNFKAMFLSILAVLSVTASGRPVSADESSDESILRVVREMTAILKDPQVKKYFTAQGDYALNYLEPESPTVYTAAADGRCAKIRVDYPSVTLTAETCSGHYASLINHDYDLTARQMLAILTSKDFIQKFDLPNEEKYLSTFSIITGGHDSVGYEFMVGGGYFEDEKFKRLPGVAAEYIAFVNLNSDDKVQWNKMNDGPGGGASVGN